MALVFFLEEILKTFVIVEKHRMSKSLSWKKAKTTKQIQSLINQLLTRANIALKKDHKSKMKRANKRLSWLLSNQCSKLQCLRYVTVRNMFTFFNGTANMHMCNTMKKCVPIFFFHHRDGINIHTHTHQQKLAC